MQKEQNKFETDYNPTHDHPSLQIDVLKSKYLDWVENNDYTESSKDNLRYFWRRFEKFCCNNCYIDYNITVGKNFLDYIHQAQKDIRNEMHYVYVLDCIFLGQEIKKQNRTYNNLPITLPLYMEVHAKYIEHCRNMQLSESTIKYKERYSSQFFVALEQENCLRFDDITPELVISISKQNHGSNRKSTYKKLLRFLADSGLTKFDYSGLVPKEQIQLRLPDIYSQEEIHLMESSVDRNTNIGKRNYAILLLASRLNMRNSDIASLKFDEVDFKVGRLSLLQEKTDEPLILPLVPEVKEALQCYINEGRPVSDSVYIFLSELAPHTVIQAGTVYAVINRIFINANIDTTGKRHGGHSLRASGASSKVNSGMSYEAVRKSLGQTYPNAIRHYVKLDINNLRKCTLPPPHPTENSLFMKFLKGEIGFE